MSFRFEVRTIGLRLLLAVVTLQSLAAQAAPRATVGQTPATLSNQTMIARLSNLAGKPELRIEYLTVHRTIEFPQLFSLTLRDGSILQASRMQRLRRSEAPSTIAGKPMAGKPVAGRICVDLKDPVSSAEFHWCLVARPGDTYMREQLTIRAGPHDLPIAELRLLDFQDASARVIGDVKGSPVADDRMFFGFEHPLAWSKVVHGEVQSGISRDLPLRANQAIDYFAVIGTFQPGQMRRAFLAYIEEERPRAYGPFLNYNSWYDIGYRNRYDEAAVLDRIRAFGAQLVEQRHVILDSFVLDDGWDDPSSLWEFDKGFEDGFAGVSREAAAFHAGVGVWLSPWGGYAEQKQQRIAFGRQHAYEIMQGGFALSGQRYFREFSKICFEMVDRYHVNLFKFDGTGNADRVFPGSTFDSDFGAAIQLIQRIRDKQPGIFINLTTGTYPSPFWLFYADSIWRGGEDHAFAGVGTFRQRWITYRDEQTWRNIVQEGPLFPLNSLMVHGMIYARQASGLSSDPASDFRDEVLSYFGSGTQLQEMYLTPSLLTRADWDILARAAKWSRSHAAVLEDTHWVGGDPGKLQVYGWAAWSPSGWIVTVRNPADHPQEFRLDLKNALELPQGEPSSFTVQQPFENPNPTAETWEASHPVSVHLRPFEVRIFEADTAHGQP